MIFPLFRRNRQDDSIDRLYGATVAQARQRAFYARYGVADTVEGRLEMVILHLVLLLNRLESEGEALRPLGQALFDRFCEDMDDNLREMGVGDLAVPRQMQRIAGAFYGRARAYRAALTADGPASLVAALWRNIYGGEAAAEPAAERLEAYVQDAVAHLRHQDATAFLAGHLSYPEPSAVEGPLAHHAREPIPLAMDRSAGAG
jgi:cytochrome b pre-mRNA-processing protein 3